MEIDASEITAWGIAMGRAPGILQRELVTTTNALTAYGAGRAQELAPVDEGALRASIIADGATFAGGGVQGSYGTSIVYAAIQEYGGTIHGNPYLVFPGRDGGLVFARSVTIPAQPYMGPSADAVRQRMHAAYSAAVDRTLAKAGISA